MISRSVSVIVLLCLLRSLAMFDVTAMNVAVPSMVTELGTSLETGQWVVAGYSLALAAGVLSAGAVVDRIGSRRMLLGGLGLLGCGALLGGLIPAPAAVIAARILMGAGAAAVLPGALAVLSAEFLPESRGRAVTVMWGVSIITLVSGPVLGGLLVESFGWSSVLLVNVPVCVIAAAGCRWLLPGRERVRGGGVDVPGMLLSAAAGAGIVFGAISLEGGGVGPVVAIPALVAGVLLIGAFVARERRTPEPLLDLTLLRRPRVAAAAIEGLLAQFALAGAIFVLTLYLQFVLGFTPVQAGVRALPMMLALLVLLPLGEWLVRKFGDIRTLVLGLVILAAGTAQLSTLSAPGNYSASVPGLVLIGAGIGLALPTSTVMLLNAVPASSAGTVSGVASTSQEFGNAMGVAVLGGILAHALTGQTGSGSNSLGSVLGSGADAVTRSAFFTGMSRAYVLATVVLILGGLLCWAVVRWSPVRASEQ